MIDNNKRVWFKLIPFDEIQPGDIVHFAEPGESPKTHKVSKGPQLNDSGQWAITVEVSFEEFSNE